MTARCYPHLVAGEDVAGAPAFESRNPARDADVLGTFAEADAALVERACLAARAAFPRWRATPAPVRGELLGRLGAIVERELEPLARLLSREVGKTLKEARGDVQEAVDTCRFFQSEGRRLYGQTVPSELPAKELSTYRRSLGVVGMITAGNFPVAVPSWKIVPALLTGNTIVWKPSEDSPLTSLAFARLVHEAGLPPGVLNVVFGGGAGSTGEHLVAAMDRGLLQKFAFTGSTAVGRRIGEIAGRNLIHPTLELGGKNPLVILRDADLDNAVQGALWASFGTAGQRCTSAGNLIVDAPILDAFLERFLAAVAAIRIGDPLLHEDVLYGPFISERFLRAWERHYELGRDCGATLAYGAGRITRERRPAGFLGDPDAGWFGWPTVWTGVRPEMRIFQEEIFGPTVNVVAVDGFDAALTAANATPYGLSSAIYTANREWAHRFKHEISAGMTSINNSTTGAEAHMPFGGVKASGNGTRESGIWVLDAYTYWHAVNDDASGHLQLAQMDTDYGRPGAPFAVADLLEA